MANLPQQPALAHKSLQINIDSEDDAKAVIQHLGKIKAAYELIGADSVEFCIAENIRRKVDGTLMGAINWCRTYTKSVKPFEGNILFPLPHYVAPLNPMPPRKPVAPPVAEPAAPPKKVNRYLRNLPDPDQTPGKSEQPVTAQPAGT